MSREKPVLTGFLTPQSTMNLQQKLWQWREQQAHSEGIESFKIFSKATLDAIVTKKPSSKEELLEIKGIKEKKYQKYGKAILSLVTAEDIGEVGDVEESLIGTEASQSPLTVSQFLDGLNIELSGMAARIQGEVTSVDERERVVYFTLKDAQDGSTLPCLIFRYAYQVSGIRISIGDEVIVEGVPEIYKPNGRLSLKVGIIEAAGEGMLKKAYDELFRKLEGEGLFDPYKKKNLPEYPERIGLITSRDGAAIDDFKMNLSACGFRVMFYPTAVEGKKAVFEILDALTYFKQHQEEIDVLVVIRGGGSLESLQAFNNETLIREIASFPVPTLLGVGHEKDITLSALVADRMVSTPTATAQTISLPWIEARHKAVTLQSELLGLFVDCLQMQSTFLEQASEAMKDFLKEVSGRVDVVAKKFVSNASRFEEVLKQRARELENTRKVLIQIFENSKRMALESLNYAEETLKVYDPTRVLKLGYSLIRQEGRLIKNSQSLKKDDILTVQFSQGSVEAIVKKII